MNNKEIRALADYLSVVVEHIPHGWNDVLYEAVTFALLELNAYTGPGLRAPTFPKALAFAQSIPKFKDFESEVFLNWLQNDIEHLDYYPL